MRDDFTRANVPQHAGNTQPDIPKRRMTPVPVTAGADMRLTATTLRLLINISGYSDENGWCWLTQQELGHLVQRHRITVNRLFQALARMGYVAIGHNLYDPRRHRKRQTVYRVTEPPAPSAPSEPAESSLFPDDPPATAK